MSKEEEQLKSLKERASNFEKIAKNLELEMKTIDVIVDHASHEAAITSPEHTKAALMFLENIKAIASLYR